MQELTFDQVEMVSGGISISGAIVGVIAGAMNVGAFGWISPNRNSCGLAGALAPVQGVLGGLVGMGVGLIMGGVSGFFEGYDKTMERLNDAWEVVNSNSM